MGMLKGAVQEAMVKTIKLLGSFPFPSIIPLSEKTLVFTLQTQPCLQYLASAGGIPRWSRLRTGQQDVWSF